MFQFMKMSSTIYLAYFTVLLEDYKGEEQNLRNLYCGTVTGNTDI